MKAITTHRATRSTGSKRAAARRNGSEAKPVVSQSVAVIGTGYVGLTTAACLAKLGHRVVAVDVDQGKIDRLSAGEVEIMEPGLTELVSHGLEEGCLRFGTSYAAAVRTADVVMLCLPTPVSPNGALDLSYIEAAAEELRPLLRPGAVVVTKSTVPVGTHEKLAHWLYPARITVASNPEFLREGTAVYDFLNPDRIVVGAETMRARTRVAQLYAGICCPVQLTDPASAELIKYAANTFLATKLSFVNEMSRLCDHVNADIDAVTHGLGTDPRIGSLFLNPGPGWGGSCFPKDTRGMDYLAQSLGLDLPVVAAASASNEVQFSYTIREIARLCARPIADSTIAVWGATFKANTSDCRDSPAIEVMRRLSGAGSEVRLFDPAATVEIRGVTQFGDPYSACEGADLLVVLTEWAEFSEADLDKVNGLMLMPVVYDTRAVVDTLAAAAAGITVARPGVPESYRVQRPAALVQAQAGSGGSMS